MAKVKPLSRRAIERQRATAARERYHAEKRRSEAAKKGWETRRNPDNLFDAMVRHLQTYRETSQGRYYSLFRTAKRMLYQAMSPSEAEGMAQNAALLAGWDLLDTIKFAKLS
jgi:hypothetical protein